ncbi:MAG TPA: protein kinase [Steroidobacteraceae bacterium]
MSAPPNLSSLPAVERALGQPQPGPAADALRADHGSQLVDTEVHRLEPTIGSAASIEDAPTVQMLSVPQQLAVKSVIDVELPAGCVLRGRYALEKVIGRGGSSIIYRAADLNHASPKDVTANVVAVKLLCSEQRSDPLALARLKREFRQMQCLSHAGIARVFDLDCDGDVWFMSMELVAGRTVKAWTETPGSLTDALRIIGACCEALEHAHSLGIVHGDLKPSNVMVADNGAVKLIDFGSAPSRSGPFAADSDPNRAATPLYASPRVLAGYIAEPRDDVFSLACLTYSILSGGQHPFGMRPSLEDGRAKSAPTYVRAIPATLFEVIERSLSAEPERRPASVAEFLRELTDADRRRRAEAGDAAIPARGSGGAMHHLDLTTNAPDTVSRSRLPTVFSKALLGERGSTTTRATRIALAALYRVGGSRGSYRRAQPFVGLMALVFAVVGFAVSFRLATHRHVLPTAESRAQASVMPPEEEATAAAQGEAPSTPSAILNGSGTIAFEASTIHASALQSLVAISVKRLHATKSRGAFEWRVEQGTAHPGVDYQRVEPQRVGFNEGQEVRTLFIPLINSRAMVLPHGTRTFTVTLEQVAGGPALGRVARVTVAIDPPPTLSRPRIFQARAEQ